MTRPRPHARAAAAPLLLALAAVFVLSSAQCGTASSGSGRAAGTGPLPGAEVAVAPGGSDAACRRGAPNVPCASFGHAYAIAQPGDVVSVAAGTYPDQSIVPSATPKSPPAVVFRAAQAHAAVVQGSLQLGTGSVTPTGSAPSHLVLDGIDVNGILRLQYGTGPPPEDIVFEHGHVWDTNASSGPLVDVNSATGVTFENDEIGPACCNSDGIDVTLPRPGAPVPTAITLARLYVHDVYDSCKDFPATLGPCSGTGFGDGASASCAPGCDHIDGSQWFGAHGATIVDSRFFRAGSQAIFLQPANGGTFQDVTIENNAVGPLCCGGYNAVSISGPGSARVGGATRILYNTVAGSLRLYGNLPANAIWAPGATVEVIGNVARSYTTSLGNGCSLQFGGAASGETLQPLYSGNLFGNQRCGGSDVRGFPVFAPSSSDALALMPARGSPGLGLGDAQVHPGRDIDGTPRPLRWPPDAGAFQRETPLIVPGRSIGEIRLGATRAEVIGFYGRPRRHTVARIAHRRVELDSYLAHGGRLSVAYEAGRVVLVATTSRYYAERSGFGVGAAVPLRMMRPTACKGGTYSWRVRGGLVLARPDAARVQIAYVGLARPAFAAC